jgi:hypothetical protein
MNADIDYREIRYRLGNYAVFRIFRKESAAFMRGFFHEQWKRRRRSDVPQSELVAALGAFQEFLRLGGEEGAPALRGVESRLIALFDALRDLVYGAAFDPAGGGG